MGHIYFSKIVLPCINHWWTNNYTHICFLQICTILHTKNWYNSAENLFLRFVLKKFTSCHHTVGCFILQLSVCHCMSVYVWNFKRTWHRYLLYLPYNLLCSHLNLNVNFFIQTILTFLTFHIFFGLISLDTAQIKSCILWIGDIFETFSVPFPQIVHLFST